MIPILAALALLGFAQSSDRVVRDRDLGFDLVLPKAFTPERDLEGFGPSIAHAFTMKASHRDGTYYVLLVERMGRTIDPYPPVSERTVTWRNHVLEVREDPAGAGNLPMVTYGVEIPLKREAIRIALSGPKEDADEVIAFLGRIVRGLLGESSWDAHGGRAPWIVPLTVLLFVAALGGGVVLVRRSRRAPVSTGTRTTTVPP